MRIPASISEDIRERIKRCDSELERVGRLVEKFRRYVEQQLELKAKREQLVRMLAIEREPATPLAGKDEASECRDLALAPREINSPDNKEEPAAPANNPVADA